MIAAMSFKKLMYTVTGCKGATLPLLISLGLFLLGLVLFLAALIMFKKAKGLKQQALSMTAERKPINSGIKATLKPPPVPKSNTQSQAEDHETSIAPAIVPPEFEDTFIQKTKDGSETETTDPDRIDPLPGLDMIPPPSVDLEENDATVLMERKKPSKDE